MSLPTKVVVVVRDDLPVNLAVNAGAVVGLSLGGRVPGPLGADGHDAAGRTHTGLNAHPVPVVTASAQQLIDLDARARLRPEVTMVGINEVARQERSYQSYLATLASTPSEDITYVAIGLYGPRNQVTALTKRLPLMEAR